MGELIDTRAARDLAQHFVEPLGRRWLHVQSVAATARQNASDAGLGQALVAAAWLHDIGYAEALHETGFHPVDGAQYLHDHGWDRWW